MRTWYPGHGKFKDVWRAWARNRSCPSVPLSVCPSMGLEREMRRWRRRKAAKLAQARKRLRFGQRDSIGPTRICVNWQITHKWRDANSIRRGIQPARCLAPHLLCLPPSLSPSHSLFVLLGCHDWKLMLFGQNRSTFRRDGPIKRCPLPETGLMPPGAARDPQQRSARPSPAGEQSTVDFLCPAAVCVFQLDSHRSATADCKNRNNIPYKYIHINIA